MTPTRACKLCLVGVPGGGKTSLVQRLLHGRFPPLEPGPGISVAAHRITLPSGESLSVTLWDVACYSALDCLGQSFLSRVHGVAAVADAASRSSVEGALALLAQVRRLHPGAAAVLLMNRRATSASLIALPPELPVFEVCARDGTGVEAAFAALAARACRPA